MLFKCIRWRDRFVTVANASMVDTVGMCLRQWQLYYSAIVWNATDSDNDILSYIIRMSPDLIDGTRSLRDGPNNLRPRNQFPLDMKYMAYGFIFLQDAVERTLVKMHTNVSDSITGVYTQQQPTVCTSVDQ